MSNQAGAGGTASADETRQAALLASAAQSAQATGAATTQESDAEPFDEARARETIKKQRESEKALKAQLKETAGALAERERKLKEFEDAQLTEKDREAKRAGELQALLEKERAQRAALAEQLLATRIASEVARQSRELGIVADLAERLIDRASVTLDDEGKPTNIADLLKALVAQYPQLQETRQSNAGTTKPSGAQVSANAGASAQAAAQNQGKANAPRILKAF